MISILNSISSGDLLVAKIPKVTPAKKDSIIELLQNSEIEFETCPKLKNSVDSFNTGFGEQNDVHFETKCKLPELKVPLYLQNYLSEFVTEEEKAAARHSLGLYNKGDVVAMSLLTAKEDLPTNADWKNVLIKQLRQGDEFFTPITQFKAVYDSNGNTLDTCLNEIQQIAVELQKAIAAINMVSNLETITSLGDIRLFLKGFKNEDNLYNIINDMDQEMLRFETTGLIK